MNNYALLIVFGIVVVVAFGFTIYFRKKYKRPTDFRAVFIMGATFILIGAENNNALILAGILLMLVGLKNRAKWKENRFRWSDLSAEEKKVKIVFLSIILLASFGSLTYFLL